MGKFTCNGKRMTRFQALRMTVVSYFKKLMIVSASMCALMWAGVLGANSFPKHVYASIPVEVPIDAPTPVLERIAACESGGMQTKKGQIVLNVNANGTVDVGKYQINLKTWGPTATKMGLDLTKESDNETMAKWIYANRGTGDWYSSASCWNK